MFLSLAVLEIIVIKVTLIDYNDRIRTLKHEAKKKIFDCNNHSALTNFCFKLFIGL